MYESEFVIKTVITIFVFCVVLILYLHIEFHLRTSNDLEFYEVELTTKEKLEEICNLKQPFLFSFMPAFETNIYLLKDKFSDFEVNVKRCFQQSKQEPESETKEKIKNHSSEADVTDIPTDSTGGPDGVPLPLENMIQLLTKQQEEMENHNIMNTNQEKIEKKNENENENEKEKENDYQNKNGKLCFLSEHNQDFLQESGLIKRFRFNDHFLRPFYVSQCNYDLCFGAKNSFTQLQYQVSSRNYFYVTNHAVELVLIPQKYSKFLYGETNYEKFEFTSPINCWNLQDQYKSSWKKAKKINITILPGQIVYIPPYWWYSFHFTLPSCIASFRYQTWMSYLAIFPLLSLSILQQYNTKRSLIENKWKLISSSTNSLSENIFATHNLSSSTMSTFDLLKLKMKKIQQQHNL